MNLAEVISIATTIRKRLVVHFKKGAEPHHCADSKLGGLCHIASLLIAEATGCKVVVGEWVRAPGSAHLLPHVWNLHQHHIVDVTETQFFRSARPPVTVLSLEDLNPATMKRVTRYHGHRTYIGSRSPWCVARYWGSCWIEPELPLRQAILQDLPSLWERPAKGSHERDRTRL